MENSSTVDQNPERELRDLRGVSSLFQALGDPLQLAALARLLEREATQKELRAHLEVQSGPLSRKMALLEEIGLVARERSHGPYAVRHRQDVLRVLEATSDLYLRQVASRVRDAEQAVRKAHRVSETGLGGRRRGRRP